MKKCYLFLAEGFEETEAVGVADVLRRGKLDVELISISSDKAVTGSHQITILADRLFSETSFDDAAMLILPGGMPGTLNLKKHEPLQQLLLRFAAGKGRISAICAAPSILGELGLLEGKEAICYPGFEASLSGASVVNQRVVISDNIITSLGVISVIEFGLAIVRLLQSDEIADKTAAGLLLL